MKEISKDNWRYNDLLSKLTIEIDEALKLLKESDQLDTTKNLVANPNPPPNLLDQCLSLCQQHRDAKPEPIRTIHHFACTGGTLISKCIASMPNTQLMSEVDPLSTPLNSSNKSRFTPTDMVSLLKQSTRGASDELVLNVFLNSLEVIYKNCTIKGQRLVLRDHTHSSYCVGAILPKRPNLLEVISEKFPILSVVTVRNPIDSYLSLKKNGWVHFEPPTFDEYCSRYIAFIDAYQGVPVIRYEDFVSNPKSVMERICDLLALKNNSDFLQLFGVHRISGDSGRSGDFIEPREQRPIEPELMVEIETSSKYEILRTMLEY